MAAAESACPANCKTGQREGQACGAKVKDTNGSSWPYCGKHRREAEKQRAAEDGRAEGLRDGVAGWLRDRGGGGGTATRPSSFTGLACVALVPPGDEGSGDRALAIARENVGRFLRDHRQEDPCFFEGLTVEDFLPADETPETVARRACRDPRTLFVVVLQEGATRPQDHTPLAALDNVVVLHVLRASSAGGGSEPCCYCVATCDRRPGGGYDEC